MRRLGSSTLATILTVAGFSALGVAGYTTVTGKSLCALSGAIACCPEKESECQKSDAAVVAAKNTQEQKACAQTCKDKAAKDAAKVVAAKNTEAAGTGCCKEKAAQEAAVVAAKAQTADKASCCPMAALAAKSAGSCHGKAVEARYMTMGAGFPVMLPAKFYVQSSTCSSTFQKVSCATPCGAEKGAAVLAASNKSASEAKSCCASKAAQGAAVVNAKNTEGAADAGCCKGSGERADGKACCGKCDGKAKGEKTVEKTSETTDKPAS